MSVSSGRLADSVRGKSWPLNTSGAFVLGRPGRPLADVVDELAEAFDLPLDVARFDVLQFIWTLNALALVNVVPSGSRLRRVADWLWLAIRLAPAATAPTPITRRRPLDTRGALKGAASAFKASFPRVAAIATVSAIVLLPLVAVAANSGPIGPLTLALGIGSGIGVGLHEAGHAASLRGVPSALVTRGRRIFVLHAPVRQRRRSLVAVSGPAAAAATGVALVALGTAGAEPPVVMLGLPLAAHSLSLTVLGGDGRAACGI